MSTPKQVRLYPQLDDQPAEHVKPHPRFTLKPQMMLVLAFLSLIALGTFLLMLPVSMASGQWNTLSYASFTAVSSVCITGLSAVNIGTEYSFLGQIIIISLIQLGGLGIMSLGTFFLLLVGGKPSTQGDSTMMVTYGTPRMGDVRRIVRHAIQFVFLFEAAGAGVLLWRYLERGWELPKACYHAVFHAISAFCNAGFALYPDSLTGFYDDPIYMICIMALIVIGGLGFLVLTNIFSIKFWRRDLTTRGRLTLHTRVVLKVTAALVFFGAIGFALLEWNHLFDGLPVWKKILASFFHSVSPRTAGFNIMPMESLGQHSVFLTAALMLIGGSPGSMAGGIKTTTLVVLFLTVRAMMRGRSEVELGNRTIPYSIVREATSIFVVYLLAVFATCFVLMLVEPVLTRQSGMGVLFEVISAFGTVGLSLNITDNLSAAGRSIIAFAMFAGRLGPITLALTIGSRVVSQHIRYPEEDLTVG